MSMEFQKIIKDYDFAVAGGGFTGVCCAVMAARQGLKTALITNRGFIGGNSGAEVRCPVDGADGEQLFNFNSRETGLIEEIRLENLHVNRDGNPYRWDMVLMDFIAAEKNLDLYLNTCIDRVDTEEVLPFGGRKDCLCPEPERKVLRITEISGIQTTSEKRFVFRAPLFADNTGDGTLSYLAGCEYKQGAESRDVYGEKIASEKETGDVLLGTLTYNAKNTGHEVKFYPPASAFDMEKSGCLEHREIPKEMFERFVWFYETGAGLDQAADGEEVAAEHRALLHSIWDHIKKHPEQYGAGNYDFEYIAPYVGKRESRRIKGLATLTEQDVYYQKDADDACGYGGWAIDLHSPKGFYGTDPENWWVYLRGIYPIPLRCAVARDCDNLFVVGRCFSVSHVALGSTRLNATLATVGQAVGIAAKICNEQGITPHALGKEDIAELHRRQWREDQTVIGYQNEDDADLALGAKLTASSEKAFAMENPTRFFAMETVYGQSMPVKPELKKISFAYRAGADAPLEVGIYRSEKPQNYGPETLLKKVTITLHATGKICMDRTGAECAGDSTSDPLETCDVRWFDIDLSDLNPEKEFLFFMFDGKGNTALELAAASDRMPSVAAIMQKPNNLPNVMDYETLTPLSHEWIRLGVPFRLRKYSTASQPNINWAFCFRTEPAMSFYGPENAANGYLRPYRQPNIWVAAGAEDEWLQIDLKEPARLREMDLTMDTNLNFRVRNVKPYDFNAIAECIRDYEVRYREAPSGKTCGNVPAGNVPEGSANGTVDGWKLLTVVEGNYQRFNRIDMKGVFASSVQIRVRATNGCPNAALYNVSIYR